MSQPSTLQRQMLQVDITTLAKSITDLVRLRINPVTADLVANEEGNLLSCLASLQFLCSDVRESRVSTEQVSA